MVLRCQELRGNPEKFRGCTRNCKLGNAGQLATGMNDPGKAANIDDQQARKPAIASFVQGRVNLQGRNLTSRETTCSRLVALHDQ